MAQYQSFPGAPGDSLTLEKLKALRLPEFAGKEFLDVGCNEGFFCGFAAHQGARRSMGIDHSRRFIERARARFPTCEFVHQSWDELPDAKFDAILLASALHYAEDQPDLLRRLIKRLKPDGVLILELGIVSSKKSEWVRVKRGDDYRLFPTMPLLREILKDYAWKWMGPSVSQSGDPVARHVLHISAKRPIAYLLLQPPAYGKSSIASSLFAPGHVPVISGDDLIDRAAKNELSAPPRLQGVLARDYSPFALDETIRRLFEEGLGEELIELWLSQVPRGDFALDAYIPVEHHGAVEEVLSRAGYLPVLLRWERVGPRLLPTDVLAQRAEEFYMSLVGPDGVAAAAEPSDKADTVVGFVDELELGEATISVRGWAIDGNGELPGCLGVQVGDELFIAGALERQLRPDVQKHMKLHHALVGFRMKVEVPGLQKAGKVGVAPRVFACDGGQVTGAPFQFARSVSEKLSAKLGSS